MEFYTRFPQGNKTLKVAIHIYKYGRDKNLMSSSFQTLIKFNFETS